MLNRVKKIIARQIYKSIEYQTRSKFFGLFIFHIINDRYEMDKIWLEVEIKRKLKKQRFLARSTHHLANTLFIYKFQKKASLSSFGSWRVMICEIV